MANDFDVFYNYANELIERKFSEEKKKEILELAYNYIASSEHATDEQIQSINENFSINDLLFIGYVLDLYYDVVLSPVVFVHRGLKVDIDPEEETLNVFISKDANIDSDICSIAKRSITTVKQCFRFLDALESCNNYKREVERISKQIHVKLLIEFNKEIWLSAPKPEELDNYVWLNKLINE